MNPVTHARACRVPRACDLSELRPLIEQLASSRAVDRITRFPRGTLTPDGRLDLCKQDVGPHHLEAITAALRDNAFVRSLLLGADFIGDTGSLHVARLLEGNAQLETVFLGCNAISPRGVERLCAAAETSPSLRGLWLKRNPLGSAGAAHVARLVRRSQSLRTLDLASTELGVDGLRLVVRALAESNRSLQRLYLCGNGWTAADAAWLGALLRSPCPIEELYVSTNQLGDGGCQILASAGLASRRLRVLGLASNGISADGASALASALHDGLPLVTLELGQAPAMSALPAAPNRIGDPGAARLAAVLSAKVPLRRLLLGGNRIGALGGAALLDALTTHESLVQLEVGRHVPREMKRKIGELVERNRWRVTADPVPADIAQAQSVYRTRMTSSPSAEVAAPAPGPEVAPEPGSEAAPEPALEPAPEPAPEPAIEPSVQVEVSDQDLDVCRRVLDQLAASPGSFFTSPRFRAVRASANRVVAAIVDESRRRAGVRAAQPRSEHGRSVQKARDARLIATAGVRNPGAAAHDAARLASSVHPSVNYSSPQHCYICKARFVERHAHYDRLCGHCARRSFARRSQTADLSGQVALVSGGRIKIGHEVALKLLDAGCTVFATTRFPRDAAERFGRHASFGRWRDRIHIIGIDLRDLHAVDRLISRFTADVGRLDILINNAALTIHRPPGYYAGLLQRELDTAGVTSSLIHALTETYRGALSAGDAQAALLGVAGMAGVTGLSGSDRVRSVALARVTLVPDADGDALFPQGTLDADGQPLDLRAQNSWSSSIEDVSLGELLEVHLVNSFAPFMLVKGLLPLLERSTARHRHIVNVSAMEGSFSRPNKTDRHPHTNMAKAALNMLTRTLAERLAISGIRMNSVDTGWVTDEQPHPVRQRNRIEHNVAPPLDAVDGAARICDPIFRAASGEVVGFGQFLKDYEPTGW